MVLKIPPGRHHWTMMSIYSKAKKQCFQESWCRYLKAREAEGFSKTLLNTIAPALPYAGYVVSAFLRRGLPPVLAFHDISIVEFASGLPCNRTTPDYWSFAQKWTCSAQELPEHSCFLRCLVWFWGHTGGWNTREGHAKELQLLQCLSKCGVGRTELQIGSRQACKQPTFPQQHAGFSQHSSSMSAAWWWTEQWWEVKFRVLVLSTPISSGASGREHSRTPRIRLSGMAAASQYAHKVISSSLRGSVRGPSWDLHYFL